MQMAEKYLQQCPVSLIIGALQIGTAFRFHITSFSITITEKTNDIKYWLEGRERRALIGYGENLNKCRHCGN